MIEDHIRPGAERAEGREDRDGHCPDLTPDWMWVVWEELDTEISRLGDSGALN